MKNFAASRFLFCICSLPSALMILQTLLVAQERRARPPKYQPGQFRGIFYDDISQVVDPNRPQVADLGNFRSAVGSVAGGTSSSSVAANGDAGRGPSGTGISTGEASGSGKWRRLADPVDLEDEVKRMKMGFDSLITTPGRFKSGDYREARGKMFVLATLLAVISEYEGDVRFKDDAALARDLLSRSAINLSGESFADAKQRKADLQDLVSGGGLGRTAPDSGTDWTTVATRSALMEYLENLMDETLRSGANDAETFTENKASLKRAAAMVAIVGQALNEEGMDEADDADYRAFSDAMTTAAIDLRNAVAGDDADAARLAVGAISQSCSACHEQYR